MNREARLKAIDLTLAHAPRPLTVDEVFAARGIGGEMSWTECKTGLVQLVAHGRAQVDGEGRYMAPRRNGTPVATPSVTEPANGKGEKASEENGITAADAVLAYLIGHGGKGYRADILAALPGYTQSAIDNALTRLVKDEQIKRLKQGFYLMVEWGSKPSEPFAETSAEPPETAKPDDDHAVDAAGHAPEPEPEPEPPTRPEALANHLADMLGQGAELLRRIDAALAAFADDPGQARATAKRLRDTADLIDALFPGGES